MEIQFEKTFTEEINYSPWKKKGISVHILRDDTVHPYISGNKWRKLKYNIDDFFSSGKKSILTFGGAYSNHLVAVAEAANILRIPSTGIIRGEEIRNERIEFLISRNMKLHFIDRASYKNKNNDYFLINLLKDLREKCFIDHAEEVFIIPEGGANKSAVKGASEIVADIYPESNYICCACGTGATIAGISTALNPLQTVIGIPVLRSEKFMMNDLINYGGNPQRIILNHNYHFGGYAKTNPELIKFCAEFFDQTAIPVEPVYTGKLIFAVDDLIRKDFFQKKDFLTIVHSGGVFKSLPELNL